MQSAELLVTQLSISPGVNIVVHQGSSDNTEIFSSLFGTEHNIPVISVAATSSQLHRSVDELITMSPSDKYQVCLLYFLVQPFSFIVVVLLTEKAPIFTKINNLLID